MVTENFVWNECVTFVTNAHPKTDNPLPKFKEISWYINHPSSLLPFQTVYFTKLLSLLELVTNLHLYNGVRTIPWGKLFRGELLRAKDLSFQTPPQKVPLRVLMRDHSYSVFPAFWVQFSKFCILLEKNQTAVWVQLYESTSESNFKILYYIIEKQMAVRHNCKISHFAVKKTNEQYSEQNNIQSFVKDLRWIFFCENSQWLSVNSMFERIMGKSLVYNFSYPDNVEKSALSS